MGTMAKVEVGFLNTDNIKPLHLHFKKPLKIQFLIHKQEKVNRLKKKKRLNHQIKIPASAENASTIPLGY